MRVAAGAAVEAADDPEELREALEVLDRFRAARPRAQEALRRYLIGADSRAE